VKRITATEPHHIHGKKLAWNSVLSLLTGILIAVLNVIFVPPMLHKFGTGLYGVLSVTWVVLANLSWLDFGFSRASAKYVAMELGLGRPEQAAQWTWTAVFTQTIMGAAGAAILWILAPTIVNHIHVQPDQASLVILTLRLFAFSIPLDFATRSLTGVLQAGQRFDWVNGLGLFANLVTFAVYAAGVARGSHFSVVIYGLFLLRLLNLVGAYWGAVRVLPTLKKFPRFASFRGIYRSHAMAMIRYGSWVTVVSIVGPMILYFDQWMISVILGIALLPFYTIPFNLLSRLGLFPSSLTSTLFPAFSALEARTEWDKIENYFVRAHRYLVTALIPMLFVLFVWAPEILRLWIDADFSQAATPAFRILIWGYGIGLLAPLSGALIEAIGRPDVLAKLYLIELPFNVIIVWTMTKKFGVIGAAMSYSIRNTIETIVVWWLVYRLVPFSGKFFIKMGLLRPGFLLALMIAAAYIIRDGHVRSMFDVSATILALVMYVIGVILFVPDARDRQIAKSYLFPLAVKKQENPIP
jgi:O-antigen/teichoic acid export membrane protein